MPNQPQLNAQAGSKVIQAWAEYIGRTGFSASQGSAGWKGGGQFARVLDVRKADLDDSMLGGPGRVQGLLQALVGVAFRTPPIAPATSGAVSRNPPAADPQLLNYFCTRVSKIEFYGPSGKKLGNTPFYSLNASADWRNARLTCLFEALPYVVLTDNVIQAAPYNGSELGRYCELYYQPALQGFQRAPVAGGGFKWAAPSPNVGTYIRFGVTQFFRRGTLTLVWRQVPEDSVYASSGIPGLPGAPTNLNNVFGKVNSDSFLGWAAGTLLCGQPKVDPVPAPFPLNANVNYPQRLFDVTYSFSVNADGWNNVPDQNSNNFYPIQTNDGNTLYGTVAFGAYVCKSL